MNSSQKPLGPLYPVTPILTHLGLNKAGSGYHQLLLLGKSPTNVILIKKPKSHHPQGLLYLFCASKLNRKKTSFLLASPPSSWSLEDWKRWGVLLEHPFFRMTNSPRPSSSPSTHMHTGKQRSICNPVTTASNYSFLFNCVIALLVGFFFPCLNLFS